MHRRAEYHLAGPRSMNGPAALLAAAIPALLAACSVDTAPRRVDCNPGLAPCAAETAFGRVVLEVSPRPIAPMAPLHVALESTGPLDEVRVELVGRDMDMGPNLNRLAPQATTRWKGSAMIPACTTGRMHWDAVLVLRLGTRTERLAFGFEAG